MPRCSRISLILLVTAIKIPSFSSIFLYFLIVIMQNNVSNKKELQFYRQCPVIAEASDFPRTFPNMSKRSFSLTLIGAYFSLREIRIWSFANGYDDSPVKLENTHAPITILKYTSKTVDTCNKADEPIYLQRYNRDELVF